MMQLCRVMKPLNAAHFNTCAESEKINSAQSQIRNNAALVCSRFQLLIGILAIVVPRSPIKNSRPVSTLLEGLLAVQTDGIL